MTKRERIPSVSIDYSHRKQSHGLDEFGMREMQARAYARRGEQYLLIKAPPASGKSRALMFIALDKLYNQDIKQVIVTVPERAIGASFQDTPLKEYGFWEDWNVSSQWNLCNASGTDGGKVKAVKAFLASNDKILICTHATFRFAVDELGVEAFDDRLLAIDEFHHVSANPNSKLGSHLAEFLAHDKVHILAMTGSYFRGDSIAVMSAEDEARFRSVTYTYYEQLNGYAHLKKLDIGYYFYSGSYIDSVLEVLDPHEKSIIHIPNVNSKESTKDKLKEVEEIMDQLGAWQGIDEETGFHRVRGDAGTVLNIADLVDPDVTKRERVITALRKKDIKTNRDYVDIIIALGMAKEGFDWIWCEHALTVGYRSSLTEIIQIIGRTTRDAPGKKYARFTNLIAEPDASAQSVTEAINNTLKAIAASLLMEQVLIPRFNFIAKNSGVGPLPNVEYGTSGYRSGKNNIGFEEEKGTYQVEMTGLTAFDSVEAQRIGRDDLTEIISTFIQDKKTLERGIFDKDLIPQELTDLQMGKIIRDKYPQLTTNDCEALRQRAIAALTLTQQGKRMINEDEGLRAGGNTALIDGIRRYAMNVRDLSVDLIDSINPFGEAYAILAKSMNEENLQQIQTLITGKKIQLTYEEARSLVERAVQFKKERNRLPSLTANDPWEKRMAQGIAFLQRKEREKPQNEED